MRLSDASASATIGDSRALVDVLTSSVGEVWVNGIWRGAQTAELSPTALSRAQG